MRQTIADGAGVLGASDAGVLLGLSPYKAPIDLWLEKTGQRPRFEGNDQTDWGHDVEPAVRSWYVRTVGEPVYVPPASIFHADIPWMRATPDGLVLDSADVDALDRSNWRRGFEAKKAGWRVAHYWGEPGTDEVPDWYLAQAQQGMAVTGMATWDLAASIGGEPPTLYRIRRDDDLIAMIVEEGERFIRHVEDRTPPPIDGSASYAAFLAERFPWSRGEIVEATPEIDEVVERLRSARLTVAAVEKDVDLLENQLKAFIGEASGLQSQHGRIGFKPRAGAPNWKAIAEFLANEAELDARGLESLAAAHRNKPSRPLTVPRTWSTK